MQNTNTVHTGGRLNRRSFLKATGAGLFVLFTTGGLPCLDDALAAPADFNAYLHIGEDGRVACYTGKIEMGQGVVTSLAQMLADELEAPLDAVDMVMGDTDLCPYDRGTYGSLSTRSFGQEMRAAAAEAREVLLVMGAERLGVSRSQVAAADGAVFLKDDPGRRVSYADLTKGKRIERTVDGASMKRSKDFDLMTESLKRSDSLEKVTGKAQYAADIRLPGMLCAAIVRPPAHGAVLESVDTSEAEAIKGVRVVRDGDLVAVLHPQPDVAAAALRTVKATFAPPPDTTVNTVDQESIFDHLQRMAPDGSVLASGGELQRGRKEAAVTAESTFLDGYVAHAPMEPHAATVRIEAGEVTVWPSSQTPFPARDAVAEALGVSSDKVRVISPYLGGGFGGKSRNRQVVEAARLAKLTGAPVQVAWTREEEFFYDSFRPAAVVRINSGATGEGELAFWDYQVYFAGSRGAEQFYDIPNHRTALHGDIWRPMDGAHPFAVGPWRAPANNTNTFARESQVDIMAARAGADPVEFRLRNLKDEKMRQLLQAAAERFGWKSAPAPSKMGRGVACGTDAGTYVVTMAEAEVDEATGAVTVTRVLTAQDMGLCVNPAGAVIQMEGCVTMGLGYALSEEVHFTGGDIHDRNFDSYEIPRFSWVPKLETLIMEKPDDPPQGGGEPAIITVGAVVANAIFDASGARLYRLPMTPSRVKAALQERP